MTEFYIDAKGLGCAQPVIMVKKALEKYDEVIIDVDTRIPVEDISTLARYTGYAADVFEGPGNTYSIKIVKRARPDASSQ